MMFVVVWCLALWLGCLYVFSVMWSELPYVVRAVVVVTVMHVLLFVLRVL